MMISSFSDNALTMIVLSVMEHYFQYRKKNQ
jgi:hypothetical protein